MRRTVDAQKRAHAAVMVNFDPSRAFERANGYRVLTCLLDWGFNPSLAQAIRSLIIRRPFKVAEWKGSIRARSRPAVAKRGAPQGSAPVPILFIVDKTAQLRPLGGLRVDAIVFSDDIALIFDLIGGETRNVFMDRRQFGINLVSDWRKGRL